MKVNKMIINYEKRNYFDDNEIDLIYQSTDSGVVRRLIDRYKNNSNQYIINMLIHSLLIGILIVLAYYTVYYDAKTLFISIISIIIYLIMELILLIFDKYVLSTRFINLILNKFYHSHYEKEMQRRLSRRFRIKISYNDYCLINGKYLKNDILYDGLDLIDIKDNKIYFNKENNTYIRNKEDNYCQIIRYLQQQLRL